MGSEMCIRDSPRRLPIIATPEGERLLGLASAFEIERFIADPMQGGHGPDVCRERTA